MEQWKQRIWKKREKEKLVKEERRWKTKQNINKKTGNYRDTAKWNRGRRRKS